jgi:4-guanidinobutyraldehyde dehydrogenase/NAD-dependent aldehyde dehydrogenase
MMETLDMGKPIKYSRAVDVNSAANCIRWYGEAVDKIYDEIAPTPSTALALITREPMGVVGVIVPWNYPMIMAAWKIAPALAAGNSVVLKPSEKSPLTALRLADLAMEAGIPRVCSMWCPALARRRARRWRCTWMLTASPLPARPVWASKSM